MEAVLHVGPADGRSRLGAQSEGAPALVLEGVHLLLDHVGPGAGRPLEELRVLEDRSLDPSVAVERAELLGLPRDPLPERLF